MTAQPSTAAISTTELSTTSSRASSRAIDSTSIASEPGVTIVAPRLTRVPQPAPLALATLRRVDSRTKRPTHGSANGPVDGPLNGPAKSPAPHLSPLAAPRLLSEQRLPEPAVPQRAVPERPPVRRPRRSLHLLTDHGSAHEAGEHASAVIATGAARRAAHDAVAENVDAGTGVDTGAQLRSWVARYALAATEVACGRRDPGQLLRWSSGEVLESLRRRHSLHTRLNRQVEACALSSSRITPRLRSVHLCALDGGDVEACAVVMDGQRVRAMALRLTWLAPVIDDDADLARLVRKLDHPRVIALELG